MRGTGVHAGHLEIDWENFKEVNGDLAIEGKNRYDKFCKICCERLEGTGYKLKRHCGRYHDGVDHGFLKHDDSQPTDCNWENWS